MVTSAPLSRVASGAAHTLRIALAVAALALAAANAHGTPADPRAQLFDGADGVNCRYFNAGGRLPWRARLGDWRDADGVLQGTHAFATAVAATGAPGSAIEWDVTPLVRAWIAGGEPESGIVLAAVPPSGTVDFASREWQDAARRPRIVVTLEGDPAQVTLAPTADATLDCSTAYALGARDRLQVGQASRTVLQFDVTPLGGRRVAHAALRMSPSAPIATAATMGVYALEPPARAHDRGEPRGLAQRYRRDEGVGRDPDVWLAADFESPAWASSWSHVSTGSHVDRVARDEAHGFAPLSGYALRVKVAQGDNFGLDMDFVFATSTGAEPEDVYFRYYLRFGADWIPTVDGGKLPGLAGTYGKSGWGGRRADGTTGWSMRGQFNRAPAPDNPLHGRTTVGNYSYHADMEGEYGDHWGWTRNGLGVLERNRWYCIEQRVKMNTPGQRNGIVQAWVDDMLALDKQDVNLRTQPGIRIERVWMNVYHGGTAPAARDMHLYIDSVVVARRPIGCRTM